MHTMPLTALAVVAGRAAPAGDGGGVPAVVLWAFGIAILLGVLALVISSARRR